MMILKNIFSKQYIDLIYSEINKSYSIENNTFLLAIFTENWDKMELKQRTKHIAKCMHNQIPEKYEKQISILEAICPHIADNENSLWGLAAMIIPQFIEDYGILEYERSIQAMEYVTQYTSCEFAIRKFIIEHPQQTMHTMHVWAKHPHPSVRRLASEGCRPHLPWGIQVPYLLENTDSILQILHTLRNDTSEFVLRSVANNLNDIAKKHPNITLEFCKNWLAEFPHQKKHIQHALRTLLKQGNTEALAICSFNSNLQVEITKHHIHTPIVSHTSPLEFSCSITNKEVLEVRAKINYCMYFLRSNNTYYKKVFALGETTIPANSAITITKKHSFKPITTRTYYAGKQFVSIQVNGKESERLGFEYI